MGTAADLRRAGVAKAFALLTGGDDFDVAAPTARARAATGAWASDGGNGPRDFVALVLDSLLVSKDEEGDGQAAPAALLDRTWEILAKKDGYDPKKPSPAASANPTQANALAIVAIVVGAVAYTAIVIYLIYRASQIVVAWLAVSASSREMVRAHADVMTMLEAHRKREAVAGGTLPFDVAELAILQRLQDAQDAAQRVDLGAVDAAAGSPVAAGGLGVLLGAAALGFGLWWWSKR